MPQKFIKIKAIILASDGKKYSAILEGQRDGDLFGGQIKYKGKYRDFSEVNHLFPIKSITKVPFIDIEHVGKKVSANNNVKDMYFSGTGSMDNKIKKMLGR